MKKQRIIIYQIILVSLWITLSGCATTYSEHTGLAPEKTQMCPGCSVITLESEPIAENPTEDTTLKVHSCTACKGPLTNLVTEGKLEHKCTICEDSSYYCDLHKLKETQPADNSEK